MEAPFYTGRLFCSQRGLPLERYSQLLLSCCHLGLPMHCAFAALKRTGIVREAKEVAIEIPTCLSSLFPVRNQAYGKLRTDDATTLMIQVASDGIS